MGAALLFGGIAGQFDAVDGEHLSADQVLGVASHEHWDKKFGDFAAQFAYKFGPRCELWGTITRDGHEQDVLTAGAFDAAAADHAAAVGEQDDLE